MQIFFCFSVIYFFGSLFSFSQEDDTQLVSYETITGLNGSVIFIERIDSTDYFLLGDQTGRIVYWNAKNNEILCGINSKNDQAYNFHYDAALQLCYVSGERGLEVLSFQDLFSEHQMKTTKFFPIEGVSYVTVNATDGLVWFSTFKGEIYSYNADLFEYNEPELRIATEKFTKQLHVNDNLLFMFSPWEQSIYSLSKLSKLESIEPVISMRCGDDARLNCRGSQCTILGKNEIFTFSLDALKKVEKVSHPVEYPYSFERGTAVDPIYIGTREGSIVQIDALSKKQTSFVIDTNVAITAISAWKEGCIAGDHTGRIYSTWGNRNSFNLDQDPASIATLESAYLLPSNKMATVHSNLNGAYVRIWDIKRAEMTDIVSFKSFKIYNLLWSATGDTLYTVHANGEINKIYWEGKTCISELVKEGSVQFISGAFIILPDNEVLLKKADAIKEWQFAVQQNPTIRFKLNAQDVEFEFSHAGINSSSSLPPVNVLESHLAEAGLGQLITEMDVLDRDIFFMKMQRSKNVTEFLERASSYNLDPNALKRFYELVNNQEIVFKILLNEKVLHKINLSEVPAYVDCTKYPTALLFYYPDRIEYYTPVNNEMQVLKCSNDPITSFVDVNSSHLLIGGLTNSKLELLDLKNPANKTAWLFYGLNDYMVYNDEGFYKNEGEPKSVITKLNGEKISFYQSDIYYNRPHEILKMLALEDSATIHVYESAYEKRLARIGVKNTIAPSKLGRISSPNLQNMPYSIQKDVLTFSIVQEEGASFSRLHILINGVPLYGSHGLTVDLMRDKSFIIQLLPGENKIEIYALDTSGFESNRIIKSIFCNLPASPSKTHFIGIGIDNFKEEGHDLSYSVKDVRDLANAMKAKLGDQLIIDTLFNQNVSISNVQALKKRLLETNINDKVIISYSGHGLLSKEYDYYLSSYTVNFHHPEIGGIPYEVLEDLLDSIPARQKLLLIDACHSGEVDKDDFREMAAVAGAKGIVQPKGAGAENTSTTNAVGLQNSFQLMQELFVNVQKGSGATIISAAAGDQFALEGGKLENGFFTYAILQYIANNQSVGINELKKYVYAEVERLSGGLQKPTSRIENLELDWRMW